MRTLRVLLLSLALIAAAPASFTPYLVKDINPWPTPESSNPSDFVTLGNLALFQVSKFGENVELWRSDGTAAGTYRLAELGHEYGGTEILAVTGNRCFFRFQTDDDHWHLWVSDGTLPGTFPLTETRFYSWQPGPAAWVSRQGVLYFASEIPGQGHGRELWRSDGTPGGTYEVLDLEPGPDSSNPAYLTGFQGRLYFSAGCALWWSNGTAAGTIRVKDVCADSLQVVGSRLLFVGADSRGSELWASDGTTAGTRRITDLAPGAASPAFHTFQVVGNRLFFTATASAARGEELYVTDGSAQGTQRLTWFSDPDALNLNSWLNAPLGSLGNRMLFAANDSAHGWELWSSDGTPNGTRMVLDACPGDCSSYPGSFLQHRGRLYFQAQGDLWITDGTAQGTHKVKDVCRGYCYNLWWWMVGTSGDRVFFVDYDDDQIFNSLWTTDGTANGTMQLAWFWGESFNFGGTAAGGVLLFSGQDDEHGIELWRSDGTPEGTQLVADVADVDLGGSNARGLMTLGQSVLFFATDPDGPALWRSDGTEAGTQVVMRDLRNRGRWTGSATRVFFVPSHLQESLWTSDGTEAGTLQVTPGGVRSLGELSSPVIKLGSRVFFSAWSRQHGAEPWITDGTRAGTRLVADLVPGPEHSFPRDFTVFAGKAWFTAAQRLWKSDGTAKGTVALGPPLGNLQLQTTYGGRLWFTGLNSQGPTELWSTDGTAANTVRIAERWAIDSLTVHAGRLWFLGNGRELWSTDGTAAGTRKLGLPTSFQALLSDGVRLYLSGTEQGLWVTDGTPAGTRKISAQGCYETYDGDGPWITFAGRLYYRARERSFYTSDGTEAGTRPVRPDGEPRNVDRLLRFGNRLVAVTGDGELWLSDGSALGTKLMNSGLGRWYPPLDWDIVKAGPRLFFPARDAETGLELWAMRE